MLHLLVSIVVLNQNAAFIHYWPEPQPVAVSIPLAIAPPTQFILPPPRLPQQAPAINMQIPPSSEPENPWMSLVRTVASVMNNTIDWEREKAHLNKLNEAPAEKNIERIFDSTGSSYIGTLPNKQSQTFLTKMTQEEPNFYYDPKLFEPKRSGFGRLINSLPPPNVMFLIDDLLKREGKKEPINFPQTSTQRNLPSFPIEKDDQNGEFHDDGTIIGLVTSGRWKNINWTRKILGIDEIPTIEEGNAIAQLLAEDSKAVTQ